MKALFDKIENLTGAFGDPEYLHLLLEPILIYGIGFGVLIYLLSLFLKDPRLQIVSLVVIAASALVIVPYLSNRAEAGARITKVYQIDQPSRASGFTANSEAWTDKRWIYLVLVAAAASAVFIGPKRNRLGFFLAVSSVVLAGWVVILSTWMHYQDAIVHHPNLKTNRSPVRERVEAREERAPATVDPAPRSTPADGGTPATRNLRPLDTADTRIPE